LEVTEGWKTLHNDESNDLFLSQNVIRIIKSRKMRLGGGYVEHTGERRKSYMVLVRKHVGKRQLGGPGHRWRKN
jgi:hypothetical protein